MRSTTALVFLALLLFATGCSRAKPTPSEPAAKPPGAPKAEKKTSPEPLTYTRVKADVAANVGKQVTWRGRLVRRLEKDDGVNHTMYYLLLAENPDQKGDYAVYLPILIDEKKATAGKDVEAAYFGKKGGEIIFGPGNLRWGTIPCEEVILTVTGTVSGELDFSTDLKGVPKSAPLLAPATIKLAAEK